KRLLSGWHGECRVPEVLPMDTSQRQPNANHSSSSGWHGQASCPWSARRIGDHAGPWSGEWLGEATGHRYGERPQLWRGEREIGCPLRGVVGWGRPHPALSPRRGKSVVRFAALLVGVALT